MNYLLDTCVISETAKPAPDTRVIRWLGERTVEQLFIPSVVIGELRKGIAKLEEGTRKTSLNGWLDEFKCRFGGQIVPFDTKAAERWGTLFAELQKTGRTPPIVDSQIVATALANDMTLVTRNTGDMDIGGVWLFNPFSDAYR